MKFVDYQGKQHKTPLTAAIANTKILVQRRRNAGTKRFDDDVLEDEHQQEQTVDFTELLAKALPESSFYRVVITPELNSVIVLTKDNDIARVIPMDGSMFKDMGEAFPLLGEHPHVETVDCKAIAKEVLDHFNGWYGTIGLQGDYCHEEDLVELIQGMMVYLIKHHPMAMASSVSGPEIVGKVIYGAMDRIEEAHSDSDADE